MEHMSIRYKMCVCLEPDSLLYRQTDHGSFIAQNACTRRDIP